MFAVRAAFAAGVVNGCAPFVQFGMCITLTCFACIHNWRAHIIYMPVHYIMGKRLNRIYPDRTIEPRHIRVPFLCRHYTHAADWPAPHFTLICRGSARVCPAASFFVPNCTLLLRRCTLIRGEMAGNKTLPPGHGITRHNKPQRPPDHGHNTA